MGLDQISYQEPRPRIVLVGFDEPFESALRNLGHNVARCKFRRSSSSPTLLCWVSPKPSHEVDILIVRDRPAFVDNKTIGFTQEFFWPSGKADTWAGFCQTILARGGACVFLVSDNGGHLLRYTQIDLNPLPTHKLWPKTSAYTWKTPDAIQELLPFLRKWFAVPKVYLGYSVRRDDQPFKKVFLEGTDGTCHAMAVTWAGQKGTILCLPDYEENAEIIDVLLQHVLSKCNPDVFPEAKDMSWLNEPEFCHPEILELHRRRIAIEAEFKDKADAIDSAIKTRIEDDQYLTSLLTGGDDALKDSVKICLEKLLAEVGAHDVNILDVDASPDLRDGLPSKREDLRFEWQGITFLVNVAGREQGLKQSSINQVDAHQRIFIKHHPEQASTVRSLLIANHAYKESSDPRKRGPMFGSSTDDAIERLKSAGYGAISTFDIYRIVRKLEHKELILNKQALLDMFCGDGIFDLDTFAQKYQLSQS